MVAKLRNYTFIDVWVYHDHINGWKSRIACVLLFVVNDDSIDREGYDALNWDTLEWNVDFVWDVRENIDVVRVLYVSSKIKRKRMKVHRVWIKRVLYNIIWLAERLSVQLEMENLMSTKMECCCRNDDMCECSIWVTWMNGNVHSVSCVLGITRWSTRHGTSLCSYYRSSVILFSRWFLAGGTSFLPTSFLDVREHSLPSARCNS